ncbi:PQQ-dependent sugar dehydrogenase [Nakamurella deserti]|uniref:PQQ-dependent sugar dehydrogenase n=1 Tax=Nakamurella deserti TaxID=2164074 RepID=UPI0013009118|nr:PQQ-dependent sugar dehydrogenase [Nakamurella deserti]
MTDGPLRRPVLRRAAALLSAAAVTLVGCADFSTEPPEATIQPSLSAAAMYPQDETAFPIPTTPASPSSGASTVPSPSAAEDPCRPSDPTIIAACLDAPWGLAVLPGGVSALVGERTTGRILEVAPQTEPVEVARVDGLDATGDGGLLGLALSPHYAEDGLVYAYVTTPTDNRIVRIARGDVPKDIFTGIPRGTGTDGHNGGRIEFGADGHLYVATGDAGIPGAGDDPASLAGKVLRLDEFGMPAPAGGTPDGTGGSVPPATGTPTAAPVPGAATDPLTAVYAHGLTDPTGLCALGDTGVGVVDRLGTADVLAPVTAGADLSATPAIWSFPVTDGGAVDCARNDVVLAATSLDQELVTALGLGPDGGFTGRPEQLAKGTYGRLLSLEAGTEGVLWATTANRDGNGEPQPRDDMVVVIPSGGGGGGDGRD